MAIVTHGTADRLLRELIKLLNSFALDVDIAGFTKNLTYNEGRRRLTA